MNSDHVLEVTEMKELVELAEMEERYTNALVIFEEFEGIICVLVGKDEGAPHFSVGHAEGVEGPEGNIAATSDDWDSFAKIGRKLGWDLEMEYYVYLRVYERYGRQIVVPKAETWYHCPPGPITPEIEARRRRAAVLAVEARLRGDTVALVTPKESDLELARQERNRLHSALSDCAVYAKVYAELYPASSGEPAEDKLLQTKTAQLKTKLAQVEASFAGIEQARESRWAALSQTKVTNQ